MNKTIIIKNLSNTEKNYLLESLKKKLPLFQIKKEFRIKGKL